MAPSWIPGALKSVPWKTLISRAPDIVDAARMVLEATRKRPEEPHDSPESDLLSRVNELYTQCRGLEDQLGTHAQLVHQVADQLDAITKGLTVLGARIRVAMALAGAALILSATAVVLALTR